MGGTAALVEWASFFVISNLMGFQYQIATVSAFVLSTTVNWILGRTFTFKESVYKEHKAKEILLVFLVSLIGLGFNMLLMWLFIDVMGLNSDAQKMVSKVMSTGVVFFWNYLSRKYLIYRG